MRYFCYILTNQSGALYVGMTNNLERRIFEHQEKLIDGFAKRYNINRLVYFEDCDSAIDAIRREKQIKGWSRKKKIDLIKRLNPTFSDLARKPKSIRHK